jgi:hypothetical protein
MSPIPEIDRNAAFPGPPGARITGFKIAPETG